MMICYLCSDLCNVWIHIYMVCNGVLSIKGDRKTIGTLVSHLRLHVCLEAAKRTEDQQNLRPGWIITGCSEIVLRRVDATSSRDVHLGPGNTEMQSQKKAGTNSPTTRTTTVLNMLEKTWLQYAVAYRSWQCKAPSEFYCVCCGQKKLVVMLFLDNKNVLDSLDRPVLSSLLSESGIDRTLCRLIRDYSSAWTQLTFFYAAC